MQALRPYGLALLRIVAGYTFLLHGSAKLFALPHVPSFDGLSVFSLLGIGGILELVGGILLVLGLFSRLAAFILSGEMAVAYFMFHASAATFALPLLNGGEAAVLFCFIFLYVAISGSGAWALDNLRKK
ncbi:LuxR family transcriptional regulator [Gallibacterium salpingitidis]|uniref:LuxR family transcriptional regulator n=1 Tax=Gallibacterium salpingitidis TaxID=505341 RepID=A0AB36E4L9_9PAST|nr:DoxX family protein [Gallibacterium salpingitidis]OBX08086.1 LuxR family transcriptional regulator [Gallibacterium salpingitidis]OBX11745.1 LuxR family transcriptional regulator [Gallibacterium salpingitidis]